MCNECGCPVSPTDIKCHICLQWFHKNCPNFHQQSCNNATENNSYWCCMNCAKLFPFHAISDEELSSILSGVDANKRLLGNNISRSNLFDSYEYNFCDFENYIDPDNNFYDYIYIYVNCRYHDDNEFKQKYKTSRGFSIIHFNCRSLSSHIYRIKEYLQCLSFNFYVIALSETWLNLYDNLDVLDLVGYDLCSKTIQDKRGGDVAMYI